MSQLLTLKGGWMGQNMFRSSLQLKRSESQFEETTNLHALTHAFGFLIKICPERDPNKIILQSKDLPAPYFAKSLLGSLSFCPLISYERTCFGKIFPVITHCVFTACHLTMSWSCLRPLTLAPDVKRGVSCFWIFISTKVLDRYSFGVDIRRWRSTSANATIPWNFQLLQILEFQLLKKFKIFKIDLQGQSRYDLQSRNVPVF